MIQNYKGEFSAIPWALECSFLNCSNKCKYCFANLQNKNRQFNILKCARQLSKQSKSNSILSYLLKNKYTVLLSNRSDPFSKNNYKIALNFIELLRQFDIPITYQTKGQFGIDEILGHKKLEHWYISIPYLDDKKRSLYEPFASYINWRLELIDKLKLFQQDVCIGVNPTSLEFITDKEFKELCKILKQKGVTGVALNDLHFGSNQRKNMDKSTRDLFFKDQKNKSLIDNLVFIFAKIAYNEGLEPYFIGYPFKSGYFSKAYEIYGYDKILPIFQEFINMLYENNKSECEVYFEDLINFFSEKLFDLKFNDVYSYLYQPYMGWFIDNKLETKKFIKLIDVLKYFWNDFKLNKGLLKYDCFFAIGDEKTQERDKDNNLIFKPLNINEYV